MAIISEEHGYLFIQIPRTGCTALAEKVLVPCLGGRPLGDKHVSLATLQADGLLSDEQRRRLLVFATVRNPFDSVVSQYTKMRVVNAKELERPQSWVHGSSSVAEGVAFAQDHDFEQWVLWRYGRQPLRRNVRRWLRLAPGLPHDYRGVDVVLRFERLQDDFDELLRRLGLEPTTIPTYNRTGHRDPDHRTHYTDRSRQVVERAFAGVIHHFGYRF